MLQFVLGLAALLAAIGIGAGFYEFTVIDPAWPKRPELIQPERGGISRKRFWIPAHILFEVCLMAALVGAWDEPLVRSWLLFALASHGLMRLWSAFDFIPKALRFERTPADEISESAARSWVRRSRLRAPLDVATFGAIMIAFGNAA